MSAIRLAPLVVLLLAACAAWDNSTPSYTPPPVDGSTPSHYAPPPPVDPTGSVTPPPEVPADFRVAVASVQLHSDCPDPAAAAGDEAPRSRERAAGAMARSARPGDSFHQPCTQSTVQLAVNSEFAGPFRVEAVRVLDPASKRVAGTTTLRQPTQWKADAGSYTPWDARVPAATDLNISYKLGDLDFSQADKQGGPIINTFMGPFILELDVSIAGVRKTIRSAEFSREPEHMIVT